MKQSVLSRLAVLALIWGSSFLSITLSACQLLVAALLLAVALPALGAGAPHASAASLTGLVILGVLGTGIAYVLNYQIITSEGATVASTVTYLLPAVAIVLGVLVLGETVTAAALAGIALVLAGVALTRRTRAPDAARRGRPHRDRGRRVPPAGRAVTGREELRATFNSAAGIYQQARPGYPEEVYAELIRLTALQPGARLLEVGCATGKATLPLARRGHPITCLEIGTDLAAQARRNLAAFGAVEVIEAAFETWQPPTEARFDLVYAATAWHWIDPAVRCGRAWELLRPGGHLALWNALHVSPADADTFFAEIQEVYDEIGEGLPPGQVWIRPGELPDDRAEIEASGLFADVVARQFDWEIRYTAAEYIRLLDTFSSHIAMNQWQRDRLYGEIRRRLAGRPDGTVRRHWGCVLQVARRA